jgi:predicted porin
MRILVTVAAALLAVTASAQTPPPAEAPAAPATASPTAAPATPAGSSALNKEEAAAAPVKKGEAPSGFTIKVGADTLNIYGLIDATIGTENNMNATGGRQTGFRTAWFSGNRWGLQARHVVSEDLSIIAKLESEYTVADGAMDTPNVLFNRDAWVGFDSKLVGQITIGRQNTLARDFAQNYGDAYGSAGVRMDEGGWTNTNNFKQMIYYAAGINGGTRVDRGINLKKKFGDFMIGAAYAMGNVTDQFSKNGTGSLGLAWNGGPYNVSGYYTQVNNNNKVHRSYAIGGNIQPIKLVRINAGLFGYNAQQNDALGKRTDIAYTVSVKLAPDEAYDLEVGYQSMRAKDAAQSGTGITANTLNAFRDASTATVKGTGHRDTIFASVFYHLDKRAEVYLAGDYLKVFDDYKVATTNGHSNQTELVTGLRFKF